MNHSKWSGFFVKLTKTAKFTPPRSKPALPKDVLCRHPREVPSPEKSARISAIVDILEQTYPDAHCELNFRSPLELLMATILSAQCTDIRVNQVTKTLFERCKAAGDYVEIPVDELESIIRSTGFYRAKAKNLKACASALVSRHGGEVPSSLEELTQLAGVGRKTANVVLGDAFHTPCGVVVDTHVQRLSGRLGLSKQRTPEKIELDLMRAIPRAKWARLSHLLIWHGRRRCDARKPDCAHCELNGLCPSAGKNAANIGRKNQPPKITAAKLGKPSSRHSKKLVKPARPRTKTLRSTL
jgi:endonuclease-3